MRMAISQNPIIPRASADMRQEKLPITNDRKNSVVFMVLFKIKYMLHI